MGTKTIGLQEDIYERLKARKRDDESFTDLVDRLLDDTTAEWREGFGTLPDGRAAELEDATATAREGMGAGLSKRQAGVIAELSEAVGDGDEAA